MNPIMRVIIVSVSQRTGEPPKPPMEDLAARLRHEMQYGRGSRPPERPDVLVGVFVADIECPHVRDVESPIPQPGE